jgi:cytochrome c-type biogenesis protein CcmH/NrfG
VKALQLAPNNRIALTEMSWVEARGGNWKGALDAAQKAVRSPPVANDAMLAYAVALSHSGQCADAHAVEEQLAKRLKNKVPKEVAEVLIENEKACAAAPASGQR